MNGVLVQGWGERSLFLSDRRQAFSPAWATTLAYRKRTHKHAWDLQMPASRSSPPPARQTLTFRSMSRTHLSTRWLVQTTGSMFCVSQRARRSWRALWGWGDSGSVGGGGTRMGSQRASIHGAGGVLAGEHWLLWPCQSGAWPFILGNGEKPASGGEGLGETQLLPSLYDPDTPLS